MAGLNGEVSWFCCGNAWGPCASTGHGACGTCNSGNFQHAWPNTSDACYAITHPEPAGSPGCPGVLRFPALHDQPVQQQRVVTSIADCGPQTDLFCGERACCGGTCAPTGSST